MKKNKIVVCVKIIKGDVNPFDACALEYALTLDNTDIIILSMGSLNTLSKLKSLTRLKDNVNIILLSDNAFAGSDTLATSYILSNAIKKINPNYVFCGRQSIDGETAQVGAEISQMLNFKLISNVLSIKNNICNTRTSKIKIKGNSVLTFERINILRQPSIFSKEREVTIFTQNDLDIDIDRCGLKGSPTRVLETYENNFGKRKCVFFERDKFNELIEEKSVKNNTENFEQKIKLKQVFAVGEIALLEAKKRFENVSYIKNNSLQNILQEIIQKSPEVILWDTNIKSREKAAKIAAILKLGLCADCTSLEENNKKLIMVRPAGSGNIMAKIICNTSPQMATIRTKTKSFNLVFCIGFGCIQYIDKIKILAKKYNAEIVGTRSVIDKGILPYEKQVGLTGKMISTKKYVTFGVSGAVQHTCAIENVEKIISINIDRNARIFDYSDYGIIADLKEILC